VSTSTVGPKTKNVNKLVKPNEIIIIAAVADTAALFATVDIAGVTCELLVDTGASASVINTPIFAKLPLEVRESLKPVKVGLRSVNGDPVRAVGMVDVEVGLANKGCRVDLVVADIGMPGILGMDVMSKLKCAVDIPARELVVDSDILLLNSLTTEGTRSVHMMGSQNIQPNCEQLVTLKVVRQPEKGKVIGIIEPNGAFERDYNLKITPTLVDTDTDEIRVMITNLTDRVTHVTDQVEMATLQPVDLVMPVIGVDRESNETEVLITPESGGSEINSGVGRPKGNGNQTSSQDAGQNKPGKDKVSNQVFENKINTIGNHVGKMSRPPSTSKKPRGELKESQEAQLPEHMRPLIEGMDQRFSKPDMEEIITLLVEYEDIFIQPGGKLGRTDIVRHKIDTGEASPIKQRMRRTPHAQRELIDEEVKKMIELGVVEESDSPWSSPIVLVRKKDGTMRFCIDYRKLNSVTKKDAYPLPRIDESFDTLGGSQYFSTLDLASGYWQVAMDEGDREKTAFTTYSGLYHFRVMPFGLATAPATFERLMDKIMRGIQWKKCLVYLDDIICLGVHLKDAIQNLEEVFRRIRKSGLKLKPSKCDLLKEQVQFLGHMVNREGIQCDSKKIEAVKDYPKPKNIHDVRAYLGFVGYYRKFIPNFATKAVPLTKLLKKEEPFAWGPTQEEAFQELREPLMKEPLLVYPDLTQPFILDTDASGFALGGVLSQVRDGRERVIAYSSKTLSRTERNYCTTKRELLGVVSMIHHFRPYLWGRTFTLRTDHAPLKWLLNFKDAEGMVARWAARIAHYNFELIHREGKKHGNADGLSRCHQCSNDGCQADGISPKRKPREASQQEAILPELSGEEWPYGLPSGEEIESEGESTSEEEGPEEEEVRGRVCPVGQTKADKTKGPEKESESDEKDAKLDPFGQEISLQELAEKQQQDPDIKVLLEWKKKWTEKPEWKEVRVKSQTVKTLWQQWDRLDVHKGLLRRKQKVDWREEPLSQWVVPLRMRPAIMKELHNQKFSGHLGITKTVNRVKARMYWPGMNEDVTRWCAGCYKCITRKPKTGPKSYPLGQAPVGDRLERVAMDILEPGVITEQGNRYVLVIGDYFTKWTEAYAIPDHTAYTVAEVFVTQFVCRYGVPQKIHTDQGREFESDLFVEICKLLGGEKTRTVPYHPQGDGMIERFNRTLLAMLSAVVNEQQDDWDDHLPYVMAAYRSSVQATTGCTPNMMMLGRESTLPIDLTLTTPGDTIFPQEPQEYVQWVREATQMAHEYARKNLKTNMIRQKRAYDQKTAIRIYPVGTWVLYWYPPKGRRKLGLGWTGPYLVIQNAMGWVLKIQKDPDGKIKTVHINDLKKYTGHTNQLPWVKFHEKPGKEIMGTQKVAMNEENQEAEGTDLNSGEQRKEEFKKGGDMTLEIETEDHSLPGDNWEQGIEQSEIEEEDVNKEPLENKEPSVNKEPLENKEPSVNKEPFENSEPSENKEPTKDKEPLAKKKEPPDLLEVNQYRRSRRKKKPPDRLGYS